MLPSHDDQHLLKLDGCFVGEAMLHDTPYTPLAEV